MASNVCLNNQSMFIADEIPDMVSSEASECI